MKTEHNLVPQRGIIFGVPDRFSKCGLFIRNLPLYCFRVDEDAVREASFDQYESVDETLLMFLGEHVLEFQEKVNKLVFKRLFASRVKVDQTELAEDAWVGRLHRSKCRLFSVTHQAPLCQLCTNVASIELPGRWQLQRSFRCTVGDFCLLHHLFYHNSSSSILQLLVICVLSLIRNCDLTGTILMICRNNTTKRHCISLIARLCLRRSWARCSRF